MKKHFEYLIFGILIIYVAGFWFFNLSTNYNVHVIRGDGSMAPTLNTGDLVIISSLVKEINPGAVISFRNAEVEKLEALGKEDSVLHRVVSIKGNQIETKGDALPESDSWQVLISDVKGVYLFKIPYLGHLSFIVAKTPFGEMSAGNFLIGLLLGLFIIYEGCDKKSALRRAFRWLAKRSEK